MPIPTVISRHAATWLKQHPELIEPFSVRLIRVRADERSLLAHSEAIREPDVPHMLRYFVFAEYYIAVIEWNPHAGKLKVLRCRLAVPPPSK